MIAHIAHIQDLQEKIEFILSKTIINYQIKKDEVNVDKLLKMEEIYENKTFYLMIKQKLKLRKYI